jgi:hypothetical protein
VALTLWTLGEPVLPYLDVVSAALCFFLVAGCVGCTMVGCCHGHPSPLGVVYNEGCAREGFPRHLIGVRLFPAPTIEAAGLFAIGMNGMIAFPVALSQVDKDQLDSHGVSIVGIDEVIYLELFG